MYPHERSLVERMKDKPFALVGVNSDGDKKKLKERMEKEKITWRSFWNGPDGTDGPIAKAWNVHSWPSVYLIDAKGVIRVKSFDDEKQLDRMIDELVKEAEKK